MLRTARRASALVLASAALVGVGATTLAPPASADLISNIRSGGAPYVIFVVKDLGGGAYWNVTTNTLYVLAAGSDAVVGAAQSAADLVATLAADGRSLLLLINGAVLVPIQDALP